MIWQPLRDRMQIELIKRGHCVGCTKNLMDADRYDPKGFDNVSVVTCECRRIYIYDKRLNDYKRATAKDLQKHGLK